MFHNSVSTQLDLKLVGVSTIVLLIIGSDSRWARGSRHDGGSQFCLYNNAADGGCNVVTGILASYTLQVSKRLHFVFNFMGQSWNEEFFSFQTFIHSWLSGGNKEVLHIFHLRIPLLRYYCLKFMLAN